MIVDVVKRRVGRRVDVSGLKVIRQANAKAARRPIRVHVIERVLVAIPAFGRTAWDQLRGQCGEDEPAFIGNVNHGLDDVAVGRLPCMDRGLFLNSGTSRIAAVHPPSAIGAVGAVTRAIRQRGAVNPFRGDRGIRYVVEPGVACLARSHELSLEEIRL